MCPVFPRHLRSIYFFFFFTTATGFTTTFFFSGTKRAYKPCTLKNARHNPNTTREKRVTAFANFCAEENLKGNFWYFLKRSAFSASVALKWSPGSMPFSFGNTYPAGFFRLRLPSGFICMALPATKVFLG